MWPVDSTAHEWLPGATWVASDTPSTSTGVLTPFSSGPFSSVPSPSCPYPFQPQQSIWPLGSTTHESSPPAASWVASDTPWTSTGVPMLELVPSPSCPYLFQPQQSTCPLERSTHE